MAGSQTRRPGIKGDKAASLNSRKGRKSKPPQRGRYQTRQAKTALDTPGGRIRAARLALDLNQTELAKLLNTDQTSVSAWEVGKTLPSGPTLAGLARLFGSSIHAIESGQGFQLPGATKVAERIDPALDLSCLPSIPAGAGGLCLHRKGLAIETLTARKLLSEVQKALKEGRPIWLVLE